MKQITEDYCNFEIAKLLKEKGFKQDCDYATSWYAAEYFKNSVLGEWFEGEHQIIEDIDDKCTISYLSDEGIFIPAPTHQMALKWLREEKGIIIIILHGCDAPIDNGWCFAIQQNGNVLSESTYTSYEEDVEGALLYVLKNLI